MRSVRAAASLPFLVAAYVALRVAWVIHPNYGSAQIRRTVQDASYSIQGAALNIRRGMGRRMY